MSYHFPSKDSEAKFYRFLRNYQMSTTTVSAALVTMKAATLANPGSVTSIKTLLDNLFLSPPTIQLFNEATRFPASPVEGVLKNDIADQLYEDYLKILNMPDPLFGLAEYQQLNSAFTSYIDLSNPHRFSVTQTYFEACLGIIFA